MVGVQSFELWASWSQIIVDMILYYFLVQKSRNINGFRSDGVHRLSCLFGHLLVNELTLAAFYKYRVQSDISAFVITSLSVSPV